MTGKIARNFLLVGFGILTLTLIGAVVFLFSQQQQLAREIAQQTNSKNGNTTSAPSEADVSAPRPSGPVYGDIGFFGEIQGDNTVFVFQDWNSSAHITKVTLFDSGTAEGGNILFSIVSTGADLPKPYTLGTIPEGFKLEKGKVFSQLIPGRHRIEITATQSGKEIMILSFVGIDAQ